MGVEEGEEIQTKGIDNLFNRIIAENFPNLEKESARCRKRTEHQTIRTSKETPPGDSKMVARGRKQKASLL
jgi:hypothetical protein